MEYSSFSALDQLDQIARESGIVFEQVVSPQSGVVSYGFDSYESLKPRKWRRHLLTGRLYENLS